MTTKKKSQDPGVVLHKTSDPGILTSWAQYMAGIDPWKRLEITAETLTGRWTAPDSTLLFFTASDPRGTKAGGFDYQHGLIVVEPLKGREIVERFLKAALPSGYGDGGYVAAIATKVRRKGVGKYLLKAAERLISEKCTRIYLFVSETNANAQRFYKSLGYEEIGKASDCLRPGNTEILMTKSLVD